MMQNFQALKERFSHLELSILPLSSVLKDNETKRLDSEYFKKEYLENEERSKSFEYLKLKDLCCFICNGDDCREYTKIGKKYIRTGDIKDFGLDLDSAETINLNFVSKTILELDDLLITRKGNYGKSQVVSNNKIINSIISSEIFQLKLKNINPYFVDVFLKSKYGQLQFEKHIHGVSNFSVTQEALLNFLIPIFPDNFQKDIEILVKDAHQKLEQSKSLYKEAEVLLYSELGLNALLQAKSASYHMKHCEISKKYSVDLVDSSVDYRLPQNDKNMNNLRLGKKYPHLNFSILPLSHSLQKTGRLDSEYYQNKYEDIEKVIKSYKGGFCRLKVDEIKDDNFTPKAEEKYRYIELANISSFGNISEPLFDLGKNLPTRARRKVKTGDFIMSSVEGSLQSCALITPEFDNCLVSTGFYVINSHQINSETLLVLFTSEFFQNYLKKFTSGTILTAISKEELQNLLIPILDINTQTQIANKLKTSFLLKKEAITLLNEAKSKVERAIANKSI